MKRQRAAKRDRAVTLRLKYLGFRIAAFLVVRVPEPVAYGIAAAAGTLAAVLTPGRRRGVAANLSQVLDRTTDPTRLRRLSRAIYQNVGRSYVDLLRSPAVDVARLRRERVRPYGLDTLRSAAAEGHGVILATMHFGCPELPLQAARGWGFRFFVVTEPLDPPELSLLFLRARSSHGHDFMPVGPAAIKMALRVLRSGGIILLVVDRDIQRSGVVVPFFGMPTSMPSGAVELARRTGAPILITVSRRRRRGTSDVTIEPRLPLQETGDREADRCANVAALVRRFEPYIRHDPGQWLVLEPLWARSKPHGGARRSQPPAAGETRMVQSATGLPLPVAEPANIYEVSGNHDG